MASLQTALLAALILLAVALQATEAGPYAANVEDSICCRGYIRYPVPLRVVESFYWTSNSCRRPGVVLRTVKQREICANPESHWVKKIIQRMNSEEGS